MEGLLVGLLYVLLYVVIAAIVVYVIIWILQAIGVQLPAMVIKLLWVVVALIALILLVQLLLGGLRPPFRVGAIESGATAALSALSPRYL